MQGWTVKHDALLQELIHYTLPGGSNDDDPPLSWEEICERWHQLAPSRGLGHKAFPCKKIVARYKEYIRPLAQGQEQEVAKNTTINTGETSSVKLIQQEIGQSVSAASNSGHGFLDELEAWAQAREGEKIAAEEGVGRDNFFDIMEKMDAEEQIKKKT